VNSIASPPRASLWRTIFLGPNGLRAGWRLVIFEILVDGLTAVPFLILKAMGVDPEKRGLTLNLLLTGEGIQVAALLAAVLILAHFERRTLGTYGLTRRGAFGARFWQGGLVGLLAVGALVGMIAACGGYHVQGLAITGMPMITSTVLWLVAMVLLGLNEELTYRGYAQYTLGSGIGFWPAAFTMSAIFAGMHYFLKPKETWVDALSVGLIGLFMAFTVWRTGSLWFAIGFHAAFDWAALFVFGAPNSANKGLPLDPHLLRATWSGPAWLTGGGLGAEASAFVFVVIAALFLGFHLVYPARAGGGATSRAAPKVIPISSR